MENLLLIYLIFNNINIDLNAKKIKKNIMNPLNIKNIYWNANNYVIKYKIWETNYFNIYFEFNDIIFELIIILLHLTFN